MEQSIAKPPMRDVEGKVAFITGGDSGIGLGIARAFVNAGMKIVITYRTSKHVEQAMDVLRAAGDRVHAIHVDVTDRAAMNLAALETVRLFGRVHVLVNNAGVGPLVGLSSATFDDWDWCMNVNVNGAFNGIRAFLPHIKSSGEGGHIVSTSSILGGLLAGAFWGVYTTSKFAVVGMMEALRSELVHTNIGVSVFCPGDVSSNILNSERNRPASLSATAATDPAHAALVQLFISKVRDAQQNVAGSPAAMEPLDVGERVLKGIRNNELYIISHPEHEQALCDRADLIRMSIRREEKLLSPRRVAFARAVRDLLIYGNELRRKGIAQERA